jgi:hypothetical protein
MATNPVPGATERKGTFKVEFLKEIEKRMQTRLIRSYLPWSILILF